MSLLTVPAGALPTTSTKRAGVRPPRPVQWPRTVDLITSPVTVTADATAHVKGAWTELIASTAADGDMVMVNVTNNNASTASEGLLDIGVGAAGSETVIVANAVGGETGNVGASISGSQLFPVVVPAGSRISVRLQNVVSSRQATVLASVISSGTRSPAALDTIGATTASSRGTNLPTSNTYIELTAATTQAYQGVVMVGCSTGSSIASETVTYTLGAGGGGSEVTLGTMSYTTSSQEVGGYSFMQTPFIHWGSIPVGTRLAVKQSVGRNYRDVILYGVPYA